MSYHDMKESAPTTEELISYFSEVLMKERSTFKRQRIFEQQEIMEVFGMDPKDNYAATEMAFIDAGLWQ